MFFSIQSFLYLLPSIIIALTIHEAAHALIAYKLGDPTAKNAGRISLNPIRHLDLYGSLLFLILGIGWGKPVPVNPFNFKNPKRDQALTALAGPLSNFLLAYLLILFVTFIPNLPPLLINFLKFNIQINILLCAFNLIPFPPLDGSKILGLIIPQRFFQKYTIFLQTNLQYIIIFILADIYLFQHIFNFSITHNLVAILSGFVSYVLYLGI